MMHTLTFFFFISSSGINRQIAVDAAFFPVVSSGDPRAVGTTQDPHGNSMLSCLSSGFLCPLTDPDSLSQVALPEPGSPLTTPHTQISIPDSYRTARSILSVFQGRS